MGVAAYQKSSRDELITFLLERDREIEKLHNHIRNTNKKIFGSKSEKLSSDQIQFSFEAQPLPPEQQLLEQEIVVEKHTRTVRRGRKALPADLPREEVIYEPEARLCPCCNSELVTIGEERSEELEKVPAELKVIVHVRVKKACPSCKSAGVLTPPLPPAVFPLERARPGAGLLADIIVSKYVDHLPLHRQEEMYRRIGIELPRQRMCDWIGGVVDLVAPLYLALRNEILGFPYIQADETTIKIQDREKKETCHTGYFWGLLGPPNLVWFHYAPSRAGEVPKEILKDFKGTVQTDAYAGYNPVFIPDSCQRIACLAHVRRKFIEVQETAQRECARILKFIADLYRIENSIRDPVKRLEVREARGKKPLAELFIYLHALHARTLPKSELAKALRYTLDQEIEIRRIFENGSFELDNNQIERQMRPVAIGRKNYLFAGSHDGARRAAALYSLLNTCKLNKVNPWQWLSDVLRRISSDRTVTAAQLLPHRWRKQH